MNTFSHISQTRINKLRSEAKQRSKTIGESLHLCLEHVAKENGFATWHQVLIQGASEVRTSSQQAHSDAEIAPGLAFQRFRGRTFDATRSYQQLLQSEGLSEFILNTPRGYVFLDMTIEGHQFQAIVADEPFIQLKSKHGKTEHGHCDLGTASIAFAQNIRHCHGEKQWSICKHETQSRIDISDLSDAGRRRLALEFGLPIESYDRYNHYNISFDIPTYFYASEAFTALVCWAKKHPRIIQQYGRGEYLGYWAISAMLDAGVKPSVDQKEIIDDLGNGRYLADAPNLNPGK